ncbi:MAG: hypothetical protein COB71_12110 [Thiotrichales bacterium]|nr:MAG: hypothetical protein COB71_12110 [Thiotrichales bacterium]
MPNGELDWKEVIATARKAFREENSDLLQSAFAPGITDGHVWNSLATLVRDVESDDSFSLALYGEAARLSPHSAVIHTNISRVLLERDSLEDVPKIKRHIELAIKYSDFSFRWWMPLRNQLAARHTERSTPTTGYKVKKDRESINCLYMEFMALERIDDQPHSRGRAFPDIFLRLLRLTFGIDRTAGSLKLAGMESDASFIHGGIGYRAEVSWDNRPNDRSEIDKLKNRLERTAGTRGVLVSMSGFTKTVSDEINRLREKCVIFTLDPDEIREVFQGKSRLESLLEEKTNQHFLTSFP